jgi:hypothetical protein
MDRLVTTTLVISCLSVTAAWGALLVWGATSLFLG